MNAILLLSARRPLSGDDDETSNVLAFAANDEVVEGVCPAERPEALMTISFVGLSEADQKRALASFPGARRCELAES